MLIRSCSKMMNGVLRRRVILMIMMLFISACQPAISTIEPLQQQLRVVNSGSEDIKGLKVLFPGRTADAEATRVEFGDVQAGQTTEYRYVPSGVYRYAAYEYLLDSRVVTQPVIDRVGESPVEGEKFTYRIEFDQKKVPGNQVQLIELLVDKP